MVRQRKSRPSSPNSLPRLWLLGINNAIHTSEIRSLSPSASRSASADLDDGHIVQIAGCSSHFEFDIRGLLRRLERTSEGSTATSRPQTARAHCKRQWRRVATIPCRRLRVIGRYSGQGSQTQPSRWRGVKRSHTCAATTSSHAPSPLSP